MNNFASSFNQKSGRDGFKEHFFRKKLKKEAWSWMFANLGFFFYHLTAAGFSISLMARSEWQAGEINKNQPVLFRFPDWKDMLFRFRCNKYSTFFLWNRCSCCHAKHFRNPHKLCINRKNILYYGNVSISDSLAILCKKGILFVACLALIGDKDQLVSQPAGLNWPINQFV